MAVAKRTGTWVFEILKETPDASDWSELQWMAAIGLRESELRAENKANKDNKTPPVLLTPLEKEMRKAEAAAVRAQQMILKQQTMSDAEKIAKAKEKLRIAQEKEDALTPEQRAERDKKKEEAQAKRKAKAAEKKAEKEAAKAALKAAPEAADEGGSASDVTEELREERKARHEAQRAKKAAHEAKKAEKAEKAAREAKKADEDASNEEDSLGN